MTFPFPIVPPREPVQAMIDRTAGSTIGNMTVAGGLAAAFDGTTSQNDAASARGAVDAGGYAYVGKDWGSGVTHNIDKFVIYPSNTSGFEDNGGNVEIRLYGSNASPANSTDGTQLYTTGVIADQTTAITVTSGITSGNYRYHWFAIRSTSPGNSYCAEAQFFETA